MLLGCELHHPAFFFRTLVKPKITVPRILECPSFVKKTASLQASPSENMFANKSTTYPHTTTCQYNKG
jgi:hypothetical protein